MQTLQAMDSIIPYPTPKIARIKDSNLGLLRLALLFCIFLYVLVYQIMFRGNHLEITQLSGVYQLHLDQPTRDNCDPINVDCQQNFTSMAELPYCVESTQRSTRKLPCKYLDAAQLEQITDEGMLVPTHTKKYLQKPACKPSAWNDWTCVGWLYNFLYKNGTVQEKRGTAKPVSDYFVADVDRFTLTIDHSVDSQIGKRLYATDMKGYLLECHHAKDADNTCKKVPIVNEPFHPETATELQTDASETTSGIRNGQRAAPLAGKEQRAEPTTHQEPQGRTENVTSGADGVASEVGMLLAYDEELQQEDALQARAKRQRNPGLKRRPRVSNKNLDRVGVIASPQGDVFTIGKLVHTAGVSMDKRRHDQPSWGGGSYRSSGFVIVIRIHYSNIEPWLGLRCLPWRDLGPHVYYQFRITKHASHDDFMLRKVTRDPRTNMRVLREYAGIHILVEQAGTMAVWDNIQMVLILTTTLALVHFTNWVTDTIALNCLPKSADYKAIKFDRPRMKGRQADKEGEPMAENDNVKRYASMTM